MIRGVFFDAAGVLYDRKVPTGKYAVRLLAERGYDREPTEAERARLRITQANASTGQVNAGDYWDEFLRVRGVTNPEERKDLTRLIMEQTHEVYGLSGARATLTALKERGLIVGIITDTIYPLEWKMQWLAQAGVAGLVDAVACSRVVRVQKPDPAIYMEALRQTSLAPDEAVFVGHEGREIDGAHAVGMVTVAVNHEPSVWADYYIAALPDLLALPLFTLPPA
ncbi:MAG: HAD family hydrolase [bacterium]|nr:HAD family hydrolase [bacterium]